MKARKMKMKTLRLLIAALCICLVAGTVETLNMVDAYGAGQDLVPGSTQKGDEISGKYIKAKKTGNTSFNIQGMDGSKKYKTTFRDLGYETFACVDGGASKSNAKNKIAYGLRLDVDMAVQGDNYIKVQYTLTNTGSAVRNVKVGSHADIMIESNDRAPILATVPDGKILQMSGAPVNDYAFKLVATTCDTLWYGGYAKRFQNFFTDMLDRGPDNVFKGDSGLTYSWDATVAPGKVWTRYVMIGTGNSDNIINVEVPDVTVPEHEVSEPAISLNTKDLYLVEGDALPTDWNSFIASSEGEVTITNPIKGSIPGNYVVTYKATNSKGSATAILNVHILPKPAQLSQTTIAGSMDFALSAVMQQTGGVSWTETGFVYGALQNPTLELNDGKANTATPVNTKSGKISATVSNLTEGITYYARAYAKAADGTVIYGEQSSGFGLNAPDYGTFAITNNNNTFTISRTGGTDGIQTVYYRTVNGSAVGGTHFTHKADSLTFNKGESSKTVTVTENPVTSKYSSYAATAYSNADRTYQMEIYRVDGGATINRNKDKATRTMTKDSAYAVDRAFYNELKKNGEVATQKHIADRKKEQGATDTSVNFTDVNRYDELNWKRQIGVKGIYGDKIKAYLKETSGYWLYRYALTGHGTSNKGYQDIWFGYQAPPTGNIDLEKSTNAKEFAGQIAFDIFTFTDDNKNNSCRTTVMGNTALVEAMGSTQDNYKIVSPKGSIINNSLIKTYSGNNYGKLTVDQDAWVCFSAHGSGEDDWYIIRYQEESILQDDATPKLIGIAPMAGGNYLPGEEITIALIFDEIIDKANSTAAGLKSTSTIKVAGADFKYAGGADTNVLYFTGKLPTNAKGSLTLDPTLDCASSIRDMSNNIATKGSVTDSINISTAAKPTVSIGSITNSNGTLTAKITANNAGKLEYVWANSSTAPTYGWRVLDKSGGTVTTRQNSGTWYLHVRAVNTDGQTAADYKSVTIQSDGNNAYAAPKLIASADNSSWAKERIITLERTPSSAEVTVKTPAGATKTVSGNNYTAKTNGLYTFTLQFGEETITSQVVVSRLDTAAPAVTINDLNNTKHADRVSLTFSVSDGESGVNSVTAKWGNTNADLTDNKDGTYSVTCPDKTGEWKLTVTAADKVGNTSTNISKTYTVNMDKPTLTVRETSKDKKGVTYSYSVDPKGNSDVSIQLPDGIETENTSGSFTITEPGDYIIIVTDAAGHFVSETIIVSDDVDGVAPEVRLYPEKFDDKSEIKVDVSVYEEGSTPEVRLGEVALTMTKDAEGIYNGSFTVTAGDIYTVTASDSAGNKGEASIIIYALIDGDNTVLELADEGRYGELPVLSKTNYTFDGWYTEETAGNKVETGNDITAYRLYARWIADSYNVTLVGDGGAGTALDKYVFGQGAQLPDDWHKQCSKFEGWYTAQTGGTKVTDISKADTGDKTYYARWSEKHENIVVDAAVAATCTKDGKTAGSHCSVCNEVLVAQTEIPAKGHTGGIATCAHKAKCSNCDSEYGEIDSGNHTGDTEIKDAREANHMTQTAGYTGDTYCAGCGKKLESGRETLPEPHVAGDDWKKNEDNHWKECSVTGCSVIIESTTATHIYDDDNDAECNICGYMRTIIPIHKHDLKHISAVNATCTNVGNTEYYKCEDCNKFFSDSAGTRELAAEEVVVSKLPHSPVELIPVEATCENKGLTKGSKCKLCGTILELQIVTASLGHDFVNDAWEYDDNNHWHKCLRCEKKDDIKAHDYDNDQDATCNTCRYSRVITPVHTHNWASEWTQDATHHWHECLTDDCDVTNNTDKSGYAEHTDNDAVIENKVAATCTTDGRYDEVICCKDCNWEISREEKRVDALGHNWGNWTVTKEATSSEDGQKQRICTRDSSHIETAIIPAVSHVHNYDREIAEEQYLKSAATCTEAAAYYKSCECGETGTETFTSGTALEHDFKWKYDDDKHWRACSHCPAVEVVAAHDYENDQDTVCNTCGYSRAVAPAHTHSWASEWTQDATHHWHKCINSDCDVTDVTAMYGYAEHIAGSAATETEPQLCTECGYIIQAALGHTHNLTKVTAKAATCTEVGNSEYYTCSCGKWFKDEGVEDEITDKDSVIIYASGHSFGDWIIDIEATETAEGSRHKECETCKYKVTEAIPKIKVPSADGNKPPKDTITADVKGDKANVKIAAEISEGKASVAEIGKTDIDKTGADTELSIDLSVLPDEISSVALTKKSLENIYDAEIKTIRIELFGTTVNMDRGTLKNIIDQMKGSDLELVVDKHQKALESMNKAQLDAVIDMKEPKIMDAYFVSGGVRISDFKGGSVEIRVPYPDKKGVIAWYINDNGNKEKVPVKYDGKTAVITVSHFSHYVLEADDDETVKPQPSKKNSDKVIVVKSISYSKNTGIKITFKKVEGVDGYYIYGNRCNTDKIYKFKKLDTLKGEDNTVFVHEETSKNTFYKYYIKAYKLVDGKKVSISRSEEIHFITAVKGYKYGNPTKVTLSKKKCTLKKGKTFSLKNRVKVYSSKTVLLHTDKIRYVSSDSKIAKVNSKGKITAKKAGKCNVYAIAQNGIAAKIAVTVK